MCECVRKLLRQCRVALRKMLAKRDKWVEEWQSQPGITSTWIQCGPPVTALAPLFSASEREYLAFWRTKKGNGQMLFQFAKLLWHFLVKLLKASQRLRDGIKTTTTIRIVHCYYLSFKYKNNSKQIRKQFLTLTKINMLAVCVFELQSFDVKCLQVGW